MTRRPLLSVALALFFGACAGAGGLPQTGPAPLPTPTPGVNPGFDTNRYPGERVMQSWRTASPYQWVGYYLASPCHRDASWMGTRASLERMGWGIALLYVGQQAFEGPPPADTVPRERIICSRTLLTNEQGRTDARDAITKTAAEGFPSGSVIFLDVERMQQVPAAMVIYYQAWLDTVLADGRFRPGTYAHRDNAPELFALAQAAFLRAGRRESPPFWVASGGAFGLTRPPSESGFPFAQVWQGALDVQRSYGGTTLLIDENVANTPSPSAPRP